MSAAPSRRDVLAAYDRALRLLTDYADAADGATCARLVGQLPTLRELREGFARATEPGSSCDHIRELGSNRCIRCRGVVPMTTPTVIERASQGDTAPSAPGSVKT